MALAPDPSSATPAVTLTGPSDRRRDVEAKQAAVASLLQEVGCDGLLLLDPMHFAWMTSGAQARGVVDAATAPAVYVNAEGRWILCSNVDTQRLFDEEVDGLGFQLKEWPWHIGRDQLLADLCQGRKIACDVPFRDCARVGAEMARLRRTLSPYEQACYRALGQIVGHALEATCRNMMQGETEREVAGQLSHRLIHRGAHPILLSVVADGLSASYRQSGYTPRQIESCCVLTAAAQKYGFCAMASRSVSFGPPPPSFQKAHDAACRVSATYVASTWPDAVPGQILATAKRVFSAVGAEHEWVLCPQGHVTGRNAVELPIYPDTEELLQANWAVTWRTTVGPASSCDTFLISDDGPRMLTIADNWPMKRIRVQGADFVRPDLLIR